jgi:glycosyltransferase involved in cell wall biosynthesis
VVVTVSEYSARELGRWLGVARERIHVVANAPAPVYRRGSTVAAIAEAARSVGLAPGARWFTYVGGFNPHKRVDRVVRAHARVAEESGADAPHLLLIGSTDADVFHGNVQEIRDAVRAGGTAGLVHWPGFVEDERLRHLHAGALALVLVSEAEGFGLPAVEAAACGAAVIATRESPLPEILAGGGIFLSPGDDEGLVEAMRQLTRDADERERLGRRGREAALRLNWEDSADAALAALRRARSGSSVPDTLAGAGAQALHPGGCV